MLFAKLFSRVLLLCLVVLLLAACDDLSVGKPSTSAPRASDPNEHYALCAERGEAIDRWKREQRQKIENEWMDEKRGLLQSHAKIERIDEEAREMRLDLQDNCNDAYMKKWGPGQ